MWEVLGILPTDDEDIIKTAYRTKLINVNPEVDPEGFKELRKAYEEACRWAQKAKKEKSPLEQWMYEIEQIYDHFYRRIDEEEWEEIFEDDICTDLDTFEDARMNMIHFFMEHYLLPQFVWKKAWETFEFEEDREILKEKIPNDFLTYMQVRAEEEDYFDYRLYDGPFDADYDSYIKKIHLFKSMIDQECIAEAEELKDELEESEIQHPYIKMEFIRYDLQAGEDGWKPIWKELEEELGDHPLLSELKGEILLKEARYQEAEEALLQALDEKGDHIIASRKLAELYQTTGEYEKAKKVCLDVLDGRIPDEKICMNMVAINEKLITLWQEREDKQMDLAWCYYQNQKFSECLSVLRKVKPEGETEFDYYNLIARVLLETGDYEEGLRMTRIWISNIEHLTGQEKEYDRKSKRYGYAHFIASMYYLELGMDERCGQYFQRALELDKDQMDVLMYRERRMDSFLRNKEYERCIQEANYAIEESEFFYPAYLYRQEAHYYLYHVQQVIDDFYHAVEIIPDQAKPYIIAVRMLMDLNMIEDASRILDMGMHNMVSDPEFEFYVLEYRRLNADEPEQLKKLIGEMKDLIGELPDKKSEIYYRLGLICDCLTEDEENKELLADAILYVSTAVKDERTKPEYFWLLADLYKKDEQYKTAMEYYYQVLQMDHSLQNVWIDIGSVYEKLGMIDKAIEAMERGISEQSDQNYVHNALMNLYLKRFAQQRKRSDFDRGIFHADRQLELVENAYFYRERAYFYIEDMQLEPALKDIAKSFELEPEDLYALSSMGYIYRLMGEYKKAIYYYKLAEKYADTPEQRFSLYRWWGPIYERDGQFTQALKCYRKCLEINSDSSDVLEEIANVYMRMNDYEKAARFYEMAMRADEDTRVYLMIKKARAYHYGGNWLKAKKTLKQLELSCGYLPEVRCQIADFYLEEKNDLKRAYRHYMDACGYDTEEPYMRMVEVYDKMGKAADAKKMSWLAEKKTCEIYGSIEDFLRKKGNQKDVYYHIALMYYYGERTDLAIQYCQRMKDRPMCDFCQYGFCFEEMFLDALIAGRNGKKEKALELCRRILMQDQNLSEVHYFMKQLEERREQ